MHVEYRPLYTNARQDASPPAVDDLVPVTDGLGYDPSLLAASQAETHEMPLGEYLEGEEEDLP